MRTGELGLGFVNELMFQWHHGDTTFGGAPLDLSPGQNSMKILLYNPDNEVANNFMPHLWIFVLKSLTPPGHEVFLLDGNAQRMSEPDLVQYVRRNHIRLVGIGAMTRMAAKAYRMPDAVRAD